MADSWVAAITSYAGGILSSATMNQELRDRMTAIFNALTADNSADADIWHGHKNGTLASRPAAAKAGRLYYATDLGVQFIDNGTRWDVIGVNTRIAEWVPDEFAFSNIPGNFKTLPAGLNWNANVSGSGDFSANLSPGLSKLRMATGGTINSTISLINQINGTTYQMDQAADRVPALLYMRYALVDLNDVTSYFGLATGVGATPDGIYFKVANAGAGGNWRCITRYAGIETNTDSTVAATTAYVDFEIEIASLTSIKFWINGTLRATHTAPANIPTTANLALQHYVTNTAAATKRLDLDRIDWIARR